MFAIGERKESIQSFAEEFTAQVIDDAVSTIAQRSIASTGRPRTASFELSDWQWTEEVDRTELLPWQQQKFQYVIDGLISGLKSRFDGIEDDFSLFQKVKLLLARAEEGKTKFFLNKALDALFSTDAGKLPENQRWSLLVNLHLAHRTEQYKTELNYYLALPSTERSERYPCVTLLHSLASVLFREIDLYEFSRKFVFELLEKAGIGDCAIEDGTPLVDCLKLDFEAFKHVPDRLKTPGFRILFEKAKGNSNYDFSPLWKSNFIAVLYPENYKFVTGEEKHLLCLRFGTPTCERVDGMYRALVGVISGEGASILGEFSLFLDSYVANNQRHLYCNHQDPRPHFWGNEAPRTEAIIAFQQKYPDNFFVVNFPMDGPFFLQTGEFQNLKNADAFMSLLLRKMLEQESDGFSFPSQERLTAHGIPSLSKSLLFVVNSVWRDFFGEKLELTSDERVIFQILMYIRLEEYFCIHMDIHSYNSSCKDAIDRAAVINTLRYYLYLLQTGRENQPEALDKLRVILHAPAFLVKEQAVIDSRRKLLLMTLEHLQKISEEQKSLIRNWYPSLGVSHEIEL